PYFLQDLRPEGFLGWAFARSYGRHLGLAEDPREWTEEDALQALSRFGVDPSGNHIIGSAALELYLNEQKNPREPLQEAHVPPGYSELADKAVALDIRNSLVPGKFPKFTALREVDGIFARVLVKFSGLDDSPSSV